MKHKKFHLKYFFKNNKPILFLALLALIIFLVLSISFYKKYGFKIRAEELEAPNESALEIVGGKDADPAKWPFVAKITFDKSQITGFSSSAAPWCSGSLLNEQWVISAGHCFITNGKKINISALTVSFTQDNNQTSYTVEDIRFRDKNLAAIASRGSNLPDFALIKLNTKVSFTPVFLPHKDLILQKNTDLFASGWGAIGQTSTGFWSTQVEYPDKLQEITLKNRESILSSSQADKFSSSSELGSICGGDSGGPLVFRDPISLSTYLIGVHSSVTGCGVSDIYHTNISYHSNVIKYVNWIEEIINPANEVPENAQIDR